jgi:surfeit locus 1 family protein
MKLPVLATLCTLIGIAILLTLGTWQVKRLHWKNGIISTLDSAYEMAEQSPSLDLNNLQPLQFGSVEGIFLADKAVLVGPKTKEGDVGHDLIVPLQIKDKTLMVDMGWTASDSIKSLPIHHANGKQGKFSGLVMEPSTNMFSSKNAPSQDLWFTTVPEEIAAAKKLGDTYPYYLRAESASYKFDAAFPNNTRFYPRNKHAQYAAFWYALAAALAVVAFLRFRKGNA